MEFNLLRLHNNLDKFIPVDFVYSFSKEELIGTDVIELNDVKVEGSIYKNALDDICLELSVKGYFILPCAITLEPVKHSFDINIEGIVEELIGENEKNVKKDENTLDILPIIWENILMEIPMRVVSEGAEGKLSNLEGKGWRVISEEDEKQINPELAKLKDLL